MKTFEQFVNNVIIEKIDWINLKKFLQKYKISKTEILTNLNNVSKDKSYLNYPILMALNNNEIVGYFYKYLGGDENFYDNGYVESNMKGVGSTLLTEMKKYGNYTTFCDIGNISSLKMHFKALPSKIICITDGSPSKDGDSSKYNKEISNKNYKNILENNRLYYFNGSDKCLLFENNKINIDVINFILNNNKIDLILDDTKLTFNPLENGISRGDLKYYLLYKNNS